MAKLSWDNVGERKFEYGIDRGVLYLDTNVGVAWNGLTEVTEKIESAEITPLYFDGRKYLDYVGPEESSLSIKAYTYPDEFLEYDGIGNDNNKIFFTGQGRKAFGLSYRSRIGSDTNQDLGYKIHIIYNITAVPSDISRETVSDSIDAMEFEWDARTRPEVVNGHRATAHVIIDSTKVPSNILLFVENILYGSDVASPQIIPPDVLSDILTEGDTSITITLNPDGISWTATGNNAVLYGITPDHFTINSDSVSVSGNYFTVSSSI
jgi:hypothetical protein